MSAGKPEALRVYDLYTKRVDERVAKVKPFSRNRSILRRTGPLSIAGKGALAER